MSWIHRVNESRIKPEDVGVESYEGRLELLQTPYESKWKQGEGCCAGEVNGNRKRGRLKTLCHQGVEGSKCLAREEEMEQNEGS